MRWRFFYEFSLNVSEHSYSKSPLRYTISGKREEEWANG